jgi:pyruvate,orthophosphate dikinase
VGRVGAVFASWMNDRAKFYRRMHDIPEAWGTAVNIQSMVFGNMGETSATGVAFTRNPSNGDNRLYGEFLINAQGEDVVAGIRTPQSLTKAAREEMGDVAPSMEEAMPRCSASSRPWSRRWSATIATCRTSSSRSSRASSTCCRPAAVSARPRPP